MDHKNLSKGYVNHLHDIPDSDGWCWWCSCFHIVQGYNGTYRPYSFLVCRHLKSNNGKGDYNEPSDHYVDQLSHRIPSLPPPPLPPPYPLPFIRLQRGCRCIIHESLSFIQCHLLMLVHVMAGSNIWALAYQLHRLLGFHSAISSTLCMEIHPFQFPLLPWQEITSLVLSSTIREVQHSFLENVFLETSQTLPALIMMLNWTAGIFGRDLSIGSTLLHFTITMLWSLIKLIYKYGTGPRMVLTVVQSHALSWSYSWTLVFMM